MSCSEGMATGGGLHPMQAAFIEHDGFQCGFCTSGQICSAVAMLSANDFWTMAGHDRFMELNAFFEHLGLIAGLVLVSMQATEANTQ